MCEVSPRTCLYVGLSARKTQKPRVQTSHDFLFMLPVAVARFCSDDNAIRYVNLLPVLCLPAKLSPLVAANALVRRGLRGGITNCSPPHLPRRTSAFAAGTGDGAKSAIPYRLIKFICGVVCRQTSLSAPGYSVKSIIDPTTCINMHNHYCWGWVPGVVNKDHNVDPNVAVLQHYKRCHLGPATCRHMLNDTSSDDTMLKFRAELVRTVSQKLTTLSV